MGITTNLFPRVSMDKNCKECGKEIFAYGFSDIISGKDICKRCEWRNYERYEWRNDDFAEK